MKIFVFLILHSLAQVSLAGNEGAGGDGVLIDGKLYLLDLVEYGIEESAHIDESGMNDPYYETIKELVSTRLRKFDDEEFHRLVTLKLIEVAKFDAMLGYLVYMALDLYEWRLVNHVLVDIPDENTVLDTEFELAQIAIRRNHTIRVSRDSWNMLDVVNKVATIFHEAVYAYIPPECSRRIVNNFHTFPCSQDSQEARDIVGVLFDDANIDRDALKVNWNGDILYTKGVVPYFLIGHLSISDSFKYSKSGGASYLIYPGYTVTSDLSDSKKFIHQPYRGKVEPHQCQRTDDRDLPRWLVSIYRTALVGSVSHAVKKDSYGNEIDYLDFSEQVRKEEGIYINVSSVEECMTKSKAILDEFVKEKKFGSGNIFGSGMDSVELD